MLTPLSPNVLGYDAVPVPTAVELYKLLDATGAEVTFTPFVMTVDVDGVFWGTLDGDCVPLANEGETWSLIWETTLAGYDDPIYDRQTLLVGFESVLPITVGTDSYITVAEADGYFVSRFNADEWAAATDDDKTRALVTATRSLGTLAYKHRKTDPAQVLDFPRAITPYPYADDWQYIVGTYDDTVVPQVVKNAECEEALALLEHGDSERLDLQAQGVTSITLGKLTETYGAANRTGGLQSSAAHSLLLPWIAGAVRIERFR